jgi:hypothetical protein
MERLTKRYNEYTGTYEYIDTVSGAGIFSSIMKGITSKFVKDTAKTLGTKALEAGVSKVGSEIGTRAANKVISVVDKKFSSPPKEVIPIVEPSKPLGNIIMKELSENKSIITPDSSLAMTKKKYYGYGKRNKKFNDQLNKLLK